MPKKAKKTPLVQTQLRACWRPRKAFPLLHLLHLFQNVDAAVTVLVHLNAFEALLCSMVCSRLRVLVDRHLHNVFQGNMPLTLWPRALTRTPLLELDKGGQYLLHEHAVRECEWHRLAKTCSSTRGSVLRLRVSFVLPVQYLRVFTAPSSVLKKQCVTVEVCKWRIGGSASNGAWPEVGISKSLCEVSQRHHLRLQAREFTILDGGVRAHLRYGIVLRLLDAPVLHSMTVRERCVMRMTRRCMHCHQRAPAYESLDSRTPEHRVLCSVCWKELFVQTAHLASRFHVAKGTGGTARSDACARTHFSIATEECGLNPSTTMRRYIACVRKGDVARALGHATWEDFLRENHRAPRAASRARRPHIGKHAYQFDHRVNAS